MSFGGNKKNKKKTTTSNFDFGDFGALNEEEEEKKTEESKANVDDGWGMFGSGKKDKKTKKKNTFEDTVGDPELSTIGTALADPGPVVEDTWVGGWGTSTAKKDKKKGKKGEEETPDPPAQAPTAPEPAAVDEWPGFGTKKNKKGGKKIIEIEEPTVNVMPEPEPEADIGWGSFGKREKKKSKKELEKAEEPSISALPDVEPDPDLDFGWGSLGKKDKKKGAKKEDKSNEVEAVAPEPEPEIEPEPEHAPEAGLSFGWGSFGRKEKKKPGKKEEKVEEPASKAVEPEPEPEIDSGWPSFGKKEKKKPGKKEDKIEEPAIKAVEPEPEPENDFGWGTFGKKGKKKGASKDLENTEQPTTTRATDPEPNTDIDWSPFGTKKDNKKSKKSIWDEPEKEEKLIVEETPEPEITENFGWGSFGSKDKKKSKKSIWDEPETAEKAAIEETIEPDITADNGWGAFGSKKEKKKGKKEDIPPPPAEIEPVAEEKPSLTRTGSKKDKKGKKSLISEINEEPVPSVEPNATTDIAGVAADDDWMSGWGSTDKKKDKKGKRNSIASSTKEDTPAPPPPPVPHIPDLSTDIWGSSKKEKKGKKGKVSEPVPDVATAPDLLEVKDILAEDDWGTSGWGITPKDKKRKEKEKDKEKREEEEREKAEEEERQRKQDEEEEERTRQEDEKKKAEEDWAASLVGLTPRERKKKERDREKEKREREKKEKEEKELKEKEEKEAAEKAEQEQREKEEQEKQEEEERIAKEKEDNWAVGLGPKEKRKKEKERERERKEKEKQEKEEKERQEQEETERLEREENERLEQEEKDRQEQEEKDRLEEEAKAKAKEKSKGKLGKKSKSSTSPEVSKTKDLLEDSVPDTAPAATEETWGSWGVSKKAKKQGGKKDMVFEAPPPAPTPPAQGLTEPEEEGDEDRPDDDWGVFAPATTRGKKNAEKGTQDKAEDLIDDNKSVKDELKKKDPSEKETPAKAAKSFWSGMGATSTAKTKANSKDAAKAKKESEAERDISNFDELVGETTKKTGNDKTDLKLTKTTTKDSKSSDAKKKAVADDFMDATLAKSKDGKAKKGVDSAKDKDKDQDDDTFNTSNKDEGFTSSWGSTSKKTSGKKANEGKTEIGQQGVANQRSAGSKGAWNEPEATGEETDDQPSMSQPTKSSKTTMSTTKSTVKSSVLQRAKEFEALEKAKNSKQESAPPAAKFDQKGALAKSKNKDPEPELVSKKKASKDSVPGSFPGDVMDDLDLLDSPPPEEEKTKKSAKSTKESKITSKNTVTPESARPPTPPPEPKEEKPVKKERARVSKAGGPTSWGLWGAPPAKEVKKEAKVKDDAGVAPAPKKEKVTGLTRSKSTKTVKEKEKEMVKSDTKSTDSDKPEKVEKPKKAESRPPKTRNSSGFGSLFGGPPPRAKTVRRSSQTSGPKATSRRASVDVDAPGLPSPPAEDAPEVSGKAAKLMGVGTGQSNKKASSKGKQKGEDLLQILGEHRDFANSDHLAVPDPYAIDSDDMVMVDGLEDPIINAPIPKKTSQLKSKTFEPEPASLRKDLPDRTRSKKDSKIEHSKSKRQSRAGNDFEDDLVMVDAGPSSGADVAEGPDDMQFITKPKGLTRSSTSAKKSESRKSGLFGGFLKTRTTDTVERPRSKTIVEQEVTPRKRTVTGGDDSAKRPRRDEQSRDGRKRSEKTDRAEQGYVYDTAGDPAGATEAEEADARREERRAKRAEKDLTAREETLKYEADRRLKRRDAEKNKLKDDKDQVKRSKKEDDAEARRQEDKEARRTAREARRAKEEEQANRDLEEEILKPRSKRRDTDKELPAESSSRPRKSDRRRSYIDRPALEVDESRRTRREERPKSVRRKSTAPVEDYFDPRNGTRGAPDTDPYGGNEHTASWVKSQASDPPEPPLVEPTIVEPAPDLRAASGADDLKAEEDLRRSSHRKSKRSSRMYTDPIAEDQDSRRRRRTEKEGIRSSEGSPEGDRYARRQSESLGGVKLGAGAKTFDGKTGQGKRASWFQKALGGKI